MRQIIVFVALLLSASGVRADVLEGRADVIDGDTIEIRQTGERVRLFGIDAPEGRQTCSDTANERYRCGGRSAEALVEIIGSDIVRCDIVEYDRYERAVAVCEAGGEDIGEALIRAGWAIEYHRYSDGRYIEAEKDARGARRGMWAGTFVAPWDFRRGIDEPYHGIEFTEVMTIIPATFRVAQGRTCGSARSCREAVEMWCGGYRRADGDGDGIPCERVCSSRSQVDEIRRAIGC